MKANIFICSFLSALITVGAIAQTTVCPAAAVTDTDSLTLTEISESPDVTEETVPLSFTWDRSDERGITFPVGDDFRTAALKEGLHLIATSIVNGDFSIEDGMAVIGTSVLNKLSDGVHELALVSLTEKIPFELTITDTQEVAQQQGFTLISDVSRTVWDRNSHKSIVIHTNALSRTFSLYEEKELLSGSLLHKNLTIDNGQITLDTELLRQLPLGEHTLSLDLEEGILTLHLTVTDSAIPEESQTEESAEESSSVEESSVPVPLITGTTEFVWDKSSQDGIVLQTITKSKNFSLYNGYHLLGSSLIHREDMTVGNGLLTIGAKILRQLTVGTHTLTLALKEGKITITVTVTDEQGETGEDSFVLTAEETNFSWDRSHLLGITVKTNSRSHTAVLLKGDEVLADKKSLNAYILAGRVGITAKVLRELDEGDNELTLQLADGSLSIHVYVTDKKHHEITADQTVFTWDKSSGKDISFYTDSASDSVSVRRTGKLLSTDSEENITLDNGTVTLKAAYLATLYNGQNKLKLTFNDGTLTVTVKVTSTGTGTGTSTILPGQNSSSGGYNNSSSYTFDPNRSNSISDLPRTGDTSPLIWMAAAVLLSVAAAVISLRKLKNKE